ncbi:MAG: hypothetical protein AB7I27_00780 [Bacteriovoracaceae bacterium]
MLKNEYQEIILGHNTLSLIRGIISRKRNLSTLLIDDPRFLAESYSSHYLSDLEILAFLRLGKTYQIPELEDIKSFLLPASVEFITDQLRIRLGQNPLANLRELVRKFPEFIQEEDLDLIYNENDDSFSHYFNEELSRFESHTFEMFQRPKTSRYELQGPKWFQHIYTQFVKYLNQESEDSKNLKFASLLHFLSLTAEDKHKISLVPEDAPFYFFRLLSPIYRLQDFLLNTQLKRRLLLLGGDYKQSSVKFWQFHQGKFENLLLESFEGVISGQKVLFFSHLPEEVPFKMYSPFLFFRKVMLSPLKRDLSLFPMTHLKFICDEQLLGSDTPYRMVALDSEISYYQWPYPEMPGSKPEFYQNELKKFYLRDCSLLPLNQIPKSFNSVQSVTMDLRFLTNYKRNEGKSKNRLPIEIVEENTPIRGFEYWGAFRYHSLGLLALCYGVEEI